MKLFFKPIHLVLLVFCCWITLVCASLLSFDESGNLIAHSYSVWGDWSAHFTFISALKERGLAWIVGDNPLFAGIPFRYPFLSHVLTYWFSQLTTLDVIHASYVSSLLLIFALPFVIFRFFRALKLSEFSALVSTLAFLLMGGTQWLAQWLPQWLLQWLPEAITRNFNPKEPLTNQFSEASVFTQFILFELFPQRAFLFGLVAFCCLFTFAIQTKTWTKKRVLALGLGFSLLSLLHVHTWMAMGTLLVFLAVQPAREILPSIDRKRLLLFGGFVAVISGVFLSFLLVLRGNGDAAPLNWDLWMPLWAQNPSAGLTKASEMNFFSFWFLNTGIFFPLAIVGIFLARKKTELQALGLSGAFLFLVALFFKIQPYFYDNLKLFTYACFFLAPFVGLALERVAHFKRFPRWVGLTLACLVLGFQVASASSDLESFRNGLQSTPFFTNAEFALAQEFKHLRDSSDSIVAINPRHNHWVPCLTGNPVLMGYPGWLWTWGINYGAREKEVQDILLGAPDALSLIQARSVRYIAAQAGDELNHQKINFVFLNEHFKKVIDRDGWLVYSTQ